MAPEQSSYSASIGNLFRRCVQCPSENPTCPTCAADETCQLISTSCDACAHTVCTPLGSIPGQAAPKKSSTPVGPIVGGVVGGVIGLLILTFAIWWFYIRPKRQQLAWENEKRSTLRAGDRRSMHSRRSVASTVMTRASNVIQIAYIPGVTVRSPPESPGLNAPPIPPLPGSTPSSNSSPGPEQHFFMPSDLRASTWSDTSTMNPRISLSPSLARTTYYGGEGEDIPPVPAQQAFRAQANMVSVKSGNNTPALSSTKSPAVQQTPKMGNSSIVAKNVVARPIEIKKQGSAPRVPTLGNLAKESTTPKPGSTATSEKSIPVFFDEKEVASPIESEKEVVSPVLSAHDIHSITPKPSFATSGRSSSVSGISRIMPAEGPLGSGPAQSSHRYSKSEGLNAMIEQALKSAAGSQVTRPELIKHDSGPFSDAHEVKENTP